VSCVIEVYGIVQHREGRSTTVHTNLGYASYKTWKGASGLFSSVGWQYQRFGEGKKKARYDSWLRDGPPECIVKQKEE